MNGSASHAVTRPGSHLSRTGQAPGLTFLQVSLETGLLLLATPLAGLSSPGAKAAGRAEDGPPVFRSPGLSWPFLPCLAEWEGFFSRRTSTLPERGHRQSVPSHLCPRCLAKA